MFNIFKPKKIVVTEWSWPRPLGADDATRRVLGQLEEPLDRWASYIGYATNAYNRERELSICLNSIQTLASNRSEYCDVMILPRANFVDSVCKSRGIAWFSMPSPPKSPLLVMSPLVEFGPSGKEIDPFGEAVEVETLATLPEGEHLRCYRFGDFFDGKGPFGRERRLLLYDNEVLTVVHNQATGQSVTLSGGLAGNQFEWQKSFTCHTCDRFGRSPHLLLAGVVETEGELAACLDEMLQNVNRSAEGMRKQREETHREWEMQKMIERAIRNSL